MASRTVARRAIPNIGTTHADYCSQEIPYTRPMTKDEIRDDDEMETGNVIVECFRERRINPALASIVSSIAEVCEKLMKDTHIPKPVENSGSRMF